VIILDGKTTSEKILSDLKIRLEEMSSKPCLAVILVGDNPASQIYVRNKQKRAKELGIESRLISCPQNLQKDELLAIIQNLNADKSVTAILLQLPLPAHLDAFDFISQISPEKDVDGFTPYNLGMLMSARNGFANACTPKGIMRLLEEYKIPLEGRHAVVVGRSNIVGKPLALMLLEKNATVTIAHSKTRNLAQITKCADILIAAAGKSGLITADMVKEGAVVVDVAINRGHDGKLCGDVDFENVKNKVSAITPVPGGVGPMTIAMLMENTVDMFLC